MKTKYASDSLTLHKMKNTTKRYGDRYDDEVSKGSYRYTQVTTMCIQVSQKEEPSQVVRDVEQLKETRLTAFEWVLFWCLARSDALLKALAQPGNSHKYGFSPV